MVATSSSWLVQLAGGEEAVQRQEVVGGSEPPCHADAWLLSLVVSQRQSAPADELSGVVDEIFSLQVSQRQSTPADELSGVVDEILTLQVSQRPSQRQSAPAGELSGVVSRRAALSPGVSDAAAELSGVVDERRCRRLTQPTAQSNSSLSRLPPKMAGAEFA